MTDGVRISEDLFTPSQLRSLSIVKSIADKNNVQCYLVGGSVRDALLLQEQLRKKSDGIKIKDLDIACNDYHPIVKELKEMGYKTEEMNFGTWQSKVGGEILEFVMPRKETYQSLSDEENEKRIKYHKRIVSKFIDNMKSIPPIDKGLLELLDKKSEGRKDVNKIIDKEIEKRIEMYKNYEREFREDVESISGDYKPSEIVKGKNVTWKEDAYRRDFTLNALYLGLNGDNWLRVIDPTGKGIEDLRKGILKTPKDPKQTFLDDPSRLIRMARFKACKKFDIDEKTKKSAMELSSEIIRVPFHKIREDMEKGMECDGFIETLYELKILDNVFPELALGRGMEQDKTHHKYDVLKHIVKVVESDALKEKVKEWKPQKDLVEYMKDVEHISENKAIDLLRDRKLVDLRWAALFHDIGKPFSKMWTDTFYYHSEIGSEIVSVVADRFNFPKKSKTINDLRKRTHKPHLHKLSPSQEYLVTMVRQHMQPLYLINTKEVKDRSLLRLINKVTDSGRFAWDEDVLMHAYADVEGSAMHAETDKKKLKELESRMKEVKSHHRTIKKQSIRGKDLIQLGLKPSKIFSTILKDVNAKIESGELNRSEAADYIMKKYGKVSS